MVKILTNCVESDLCNVFESLMNTRTYSAVTIPLVFREKSFCEVVNAKACKPKLGSYSILSLVVNANKSEFWSSQNDLNTSIIDSNCIYFKWIQIEVLNGQALVITCFCHIDLLLRETGAATWSCNCKSSSMLFYLFN